MIESIVNIPGQLLGIKYNISHFLNKVIIDNGFLFFNIFMIVHFLSGFVIMYFIIKHRKNLKPRYTYLFLLEFLILWELFESFIRVTGITLGGFFDFGVEYPNDILLDLAIGMCGGLFATKIVK